MAAPAGLRETDSPLLKRLLAFDPDRIYGIQEQGGVWQHHDRAWSELYSHPGAYQHAIWGSAPDDIWVAVLGPTLVHFDGAKWKPQNVGKATIRALWGTGKNQMWAAADDGTVHAFDGRRFRKQFSAKLSVYAGHGTAPNHIVLAGPDGTAIWDGRQSRFEPAPPNGDYGTGFFCVWTSGADFAIAGGYGGVLVRYDGSTWHREPIDFKYKLWDAWGTSKDDAWVVGEDGAIFHHDGRSWRREDSGTNVNLFAVGGTPAYIVVSGSRTMRIKRRPAKP